MVLAVSSVEELQALSTDDSKTFVVRSTDCRDTQFYIIGWEEPGSDESISGKSEELLSELYAHLLESSVVVREDIHMSQLCSCSSWLLLPLDGLISPDDITAMDQHIKENVNSSKIFPTKVSYKEMLSRHIDEPKVEVEKPVAPKHKWEPKFVFKAAPSVRIDRKYGKQPDYVDADEGIYKISCMLWNHSHCRQI